MNNIIKIVGFCGILTLAAPAFAQVSFDIHLGPPPPRREVVMEAPFEGAIWVAGYNQYDYDNNEYRWQPGSWQRPPREGASWVKPRYDRRGGRYGFVAGHWKDQPQGRARGDNGRGNNGRDNQGRDNHGRDNQGRDNQGRDNQGRGNQGRDNQGRNNQGQDNHGRDNHGQGDRGKNNQGQDNKGRDNQGHDDKEQENHGHGNDK
jgi:PPE-repeat protein